MWPADIFTIPLFPKIASAMGGYMVAGHSGAFYTPEIGMEFPCETAGSAPEVSITVRGALFMPGGNHASKAGRTVDI